MDGRKILSDYTDEELIIYLENNNSIELLELSAYCSEILRRLIKRKQLNFPLKPESAEECSNPSSKVD